MQEILVSISLLYQFGWFPNIFLQSVFVHPLLLSPLLPPLLKASALVRQPNLVITQVSQVHGLNLGLLISGMLQWTQIGKLWYRNGSSLKLQARPKEYVSLLYSSLFILTIKIYRL